MSSPQQQLCTVEVYPGLFYLTAVNPVGEHDPSDLVPELLDTDAVCLFGDNGVTFNSRFQSHTTIVTIDFLDAAPARAKATPEPAMDLPADSADGTVVLTAGGLVFANPDQVMPDTAVELPYLGPSHVRATRSVLADREAYVPPADEANPHGLEAWSVSFWPITPPSPRTRT